MIIQVVKTVDDTSSIQNRPIAVTATIHCSAIKPLALEQVISSDRFRGNVIARHL